MYPGIEPISPTFPPPNTPLDKNVSSQWGCQSWPWTRTHVSSWRYEEEEPEAVFCFHYQGLRHSLTPCRKMHVHGMCKNSTNSYWSWSIFNLFFSSPLAAEQGAQRVDSAVSYHPSHVPLLLWQPWAWAGEQIRNKSPDQLKRQWNETICALAVLLLLLLLLLDWFSIHSPSMPSCKKRKDFEHLPKTKSMSQNNFGGAKAEERVYSIVMPVCQWPTQLVVVSHFSAQNLRQTTAR